MCNSRQHHRSCSRKRRLCREIRTRRSRCHHYRNQLLVLWLRNNGYAPALAESSLGIQRHRASGSRLSGCRISRTRTERAACIRYYGHDVQDLDDNTIPADVAEKLLRFARAAMAVANMRGKSYLSFGSVCMGIAGSIVDPDFFQEYLGIRNEAWTKLRSCAVWKKESMTMKNMPRQWPGLKNIASPTKGKTLRTVPKSAKPVKRRMPTGNLL